MVYSPSVSAATYPTLADLAKRLDPDGSIPKIAELLAESNPILEDCPFYEGNLATGHRYTVRTGIPEPTWRRLNYGVYPTKSAVAQVDDQCAMLEAYAEIDKRLAELNGNSAAFRLSEDRPHIEGMNQAFVDTLFYGDSSTEPEKFLGLAPRYNTLGAPANKPTAITRSSYLNHIIDMGGQTASSQASMWLVTWGENTVHGIYPKGMTAGLKHEDLGEVTLFDNNGGRFQGYRSHYEWNVGLTVRDWRYIVRIANIEVADLEDPATQKALYHKMIMALHTIPNRRMGRPIFYAGAAVSTMLDLAAVEKANISLGYNNVFGQEVLTFRGIPIKECDALLETEDVLT